MRVVGTLGWVSEIIGHFSRQSMNSAPIHPRQIVTSILYGDDDVSARVMRMSGQEKVSHSLTAPLGSN